MDRVYKKGLSILLMLLMVMGVMSGVIAPSGGTAHAAVSFAGGTGSASDPYQIATADQLDLVRNYLGVGLYFELTADIDLSSYANWEPIGTSGYNDYFFGNMDGNGFKITNLKIDKQEEDYIGLFQSSMGIITNIFLENIDVNGNIYVGGLVGYNDGTISNSYAGGRVSGGNQDVGGLVGRNDGTISNSYANGSVGGSYYYVGGLVGYNYYGTISNSYATGSVSGKNTVGSLVGVNHNGVISNNYATGSVTGTYVVGGLVGYNDGTISNSYATGSVSGGNQYMGGLVGTNSGTTINHSFYDSNTTGQQDTGKGTGKTTEEMQNPNTFSDWDFSEDWYMLSDEYPQLWGFIALRPGTNAGTTKLIGVTSDMEYKVNTGSYTTGAYASVDNIVVEVGDKIYVREKNTQPASDEQILSVDVQDIKIIPMTTREIAGVTAPVAGATPVTTIADTAEYTTSIAWSPVDATFAGAVAYTATITLTPKTGYTLTGVGADFFNVVGATTTKNAVGSGIVTAEFPVTATPIPTREIAGVTAPVAGATPVATIADTAEYTASIEWSPVDATFAGTVAYTATITLTPKTGYTLTGVGADFFKVDGAITTNEANSGVVTAVYPPTAAMPIAKAAIAGVTAPVSGATPVTAVTYSAEYTATVSWSPVTTLFAPEAAYTATITIAPKAGYTLTGVPVNFFTVAGATTMNAADSGVVTAEFPATAAIPVTEVPVTTVPIATADIAGVTAPVTGATPVTTVTYSAEYTATVSWSPATTLFVPGTAYTATIAITPKVGYTLTGVPANFFIVGGATTTNEENSGVVIALFPATAPVSTDTDPDTGTNTGTGSTFTLPTNSIVTSTNGTLTLPVNKSGEVSFEDAVKISIPVGAINKELILSIQKVLDTQKLFINKEVLLSPVYEITKNFAEDFSKPVTMNFTFDSTLVKSNQKAALFYYDEVKKAWVEVTGGKIEENHIIVEVNHLGKYAVLSVDEVTGLPINEPVTDTSTIINLNDVAGHWAEESIKQALSIGMVKGYLDGTFQPNRTVTRAEFAVMLMNVLKPQGAGVDLTFTDTAKIGAWAQTAIAQAVQAGMITGYEDGGFRPNAEITRAEMAVILAKALGESTEVKVTTSFADDKDIPAWAKGSVDFVKQSGMVQGKGDNEFAPQDSATRAEAVTVLLKLLAQLNK